MKYHSKRVAEDLCVRKSENSAQIWDWWGGGETLASAGAGLGLGLDVWREFRVGGSLEVGVGVLRLHIKEARITLLQNSQYKII